MSEKEVVEGTIENQANGQESQTAGKVRRRGISNDTKGTTRKKFQHTDAIPGVGVFLGSFANLSMTFATITSGNLPSFTGHAIPKLHLDFVSLHQVASDRKYAPYDIFPIESNTDTIPGGSKEWTFKQVMDNIKHLLDVLVFKGRAMTEEEMDMLELGYCDYTIDEYDNYVYEPVEAEDVIKAWQVLFENVIKIVQTGNNGRSALLDNSGKPVEVWGKMIRYYKSKGEWVSAASKSQEGDLVFPSFTGTGIFELVTKNKDTKKPNYPVMSLDITKECIAPMNIAKKQPNLNSAPNMGGIGIGAGLVPPMANMGGGNESFTSFQGGGTDDNLPF